MPLTLRIAALLIVAFAIGCHRPDGAQATPSGAELFRSCDSCHGAQGLGNPQIQAPAIAGLPDWYVEAQLQKFRTGIRGAHPDDHEGLRMRPMSRQMMNAAEVTAVAKYVSTLPGSKTEPQIKDGNAQMGAASYATCIACHGMKGEGNAAMKAPPLVRQSDWYLLSQLKKFKAGIRGANPADVSGNTMRAMSSVVADEQAMKNVIAHIGTLSP